MKQAMKKMTMAQQIAHLKASREIARMQRNEYQLKLISVARQLAKITAQVAAIQRRFFKTKKVIK